MNVKLRHRLFLKIFAAFWLFLLLLMLVVITLPQLSGQIRHDAPRWAVHTLDNIAAMLERPVKRPGSPRHSIEHIINRPHPGLEIHLVDSNGKLFSRHKEWKALRSFIINSDDSSHSQAIVADKQMLFGPRLIELQGEPYHLYISSQPQAAGHMILLLLSQKGILILLLILLITPLCLALAWYITSPLSKLDKAAQAIARGELDTPLPPLKRQDEIGRLSLSLHQMVSILTHQLKSQQQLLSDISHELRSPLTRLMMASGIARKKLGSSAELERIELEAQRLEEMIASLLTLTRLNHQHTPLESIPIQTLLAPLCEDIEFEARELGKQFNHSALPATPIQAYPTLLRSAVENICRNALRYAHQQIQLAVTETTQTLTITVCDDGPGVKEEELEAIFRPFYRPAQARDRDSGGVGLGLAITANAVARHNGQIKASLLNKQAAKHPQTEGQSPALNFCITITLPLNQTGNRKNEGVR